MCAFALVDTCRFGIGLELAVAVQEDMEVETDGEAVEGGEKAFTIDLTQPGYRWVACSQPWELLTASIFLPPCTGNLVLYILNTIVLL